MLKRFRQLCLLFIILMALPHYLRAIENLPAFPGAEGEGAYTPGGRGGQILFVTNLNDSGPGSLRQACITKGPRIILFKVSGIIELYSSLIINEPFVTIAGQTAPGDGICLKNYDLVIINTHDVIIRYLRARPGDLAGAEVDAISILKSRNVILDHCSTSWSVDEALSASGAGTDKVTVQWCMITESLNNSVHHKGEHGYGTLVRVDGNVTFHHNLYASNSSRNPRPGAYGDMERGGFLDFRNNVIYNYGIYPGYTAVDKAAINYINNYIIPGPSTKPDMRTTAFVVGGANTTMYVDGNIHTGRSEKNEPNWKLIEIPDSLNITEISIPRPLVSAPVNTESAPDAYEHVLQNAGAVLPKRDLVDKRIVDYVRNGGGMIINSVQQVNSWPEYKSALPETDSDDDGMPDSWETQYLLNPRDKSDNSLDNDQDGYINIEEYINNTKP